jgi:hypothetical protein
VQINTDVAFKEWAIVVETLGHGEQIFILRKGGIRETRGEFHVEHRRFWLFPTRFHESEESVIPSKRPVLKALAAQAPANSVRIEFLAVADLVVRLTDPAALQRLEGRHIWSGPILRERFDFGRAEGIHLLVTRVYRRPAPWVFAWREEYGGCKSWVQLEHSLAGDGLVPVLGDTEFAAQRDELLAVLGPPPFAEVSDEDHSVPIMEATTPFGQNKKGNS